MQCSICSAWSHLQCARLTQRTAKKVIFKCHVCKVLPPISPSVSLNGSQVAAKSSSVVRESQQFASTAFESSTSVAAKKVTMQSTIQSTSYSSPRSCTVDVPPSVVAREVTTTVTSPATSTSSAPPPNGSLMSPGSTDLCSAGGFSGARAHVAQGAISRDEVATLLAQRESAIRADLNIRLLAIEDQISRLSQSLHTIKESCRPLQAFSYASAASGFRQHYPNSHPSQQLHGISPTHDSRSASSLPFRVVWGTQRNCPPQVLWKAITALLPAAVHSAVGVRRSIRQRGSKWIWWFTVMAPPEVMHQIEDIWTTLETRSGWSLRASLSNPHHSTQRRRSYPTPSSRAGGERGALESLPPTLTSNTMATSTCVVHNSHRSWCHRSSSPPSLCAATNTVAAPLSSCTPLGP